MGEWMNREMRLIHKVTDTIKFTIGGWQNARMDGQWLTGTVQAWIGAEIRCT